MTLATFMNEVTIIFIIMEFESGKLKTKILLFTQHFGLSHEHGHSLLNFQNSWKTYLGFQLTIIVFHHDFQFTIIIFHPDEISGCLFIIKCFAQVNLFKQQQLSRLNFVKNSRTFVEVSGEKHIKN